MVLSKTSGATLVRYPNRVGVTGGDFFDRYVKVWECSFDVVKILFKAIGAYRGVRRVPDLVDMLCVFVEDFRGNFSIAFGKEVGKVEVGNLDEGKMTERRVDERVESEYERMRMEENCAFDVVSACRS